jgi:hypothetical protein
MLIHTRLHVSAKTSHLQALQRTFRQNVNYICVRIATLLLQLCSTDWMCLTRDIKCEIVYKNRYKMLNFLNNFNILYLLLSTISHLTSRIKHIQLVEYNCNNNVAICAHIKFMCCLNVLCKAWRWLVLAETCSLVCINIF